MAVSGYFYEPHGEPEKFPETAQEVLDDGSIQMTMQLEGKKIDGHRRVVIPAPGADRMKQQSLLRAIRRQFIIPDEDIVISHLNNAFVCQGFAPYPTDCFQI